MFYIYVYLDQRSPGEWIFDDCVFKHKPFYVGKGKAGRISNHCMPSSLRRKSLKNSIIKSIFADLGELPIHYKVYENLSEDEAFKIEREMIAHFGRQDNGTGILGNHTDGGEGNQGITLNNAHCRKPLYEYDLNGRFLKSWTSGAEYEQQTGNLSGNICTAVKRSGTAYGSQWSYEKNDYLKPKIINQTPIKYRRIQQIEPQTKEIIATFNTALEAEQILGLRHGARNKIYECLQGKLKTYLGYAWTLE